ncbi:hypothetical protein PFX98_02845 [Paucibacter sediminis]|uniref:Uncharacterized protein n=1 Tax=Paucibacter sediminis TaxID=3019553 RepID=A0AA95SNI0_9BURK|nr:hypothetical protein [Paucibacter sp. S2-9]WIT12562.1 hypothetical protein PFX98_02845 [Paucibacter sp. S2-9]
MSQPDSRLATAVLALVAQRPDSTQPASAHPAVAARKLGQQAAAKAAAAAGALALPPGPLGWLTILPEMMAVWRIQAQLVADIAALYGRSAELGQAQMLYCLFRHTAAQGLRDLIVRVGERVLVRPATTAVLKQIATSIGLKLSERALGKSVARWMPLVGAAGVSAYAWYDTQQVGKAALELFEREMVVEG